MVGGWYGDSELADSNEIAISNVSRLEIICSSALIIITSVIIAFAARRIRYTNCNEWMAVDFPEYLSTISQLDDILLHICVKELIWQNISNLDIHTCHTKQ